MAKAHSTPTRRRVVPKTCQERWLKVKRGYYERRSRPRTGHSYSAPRPVPWVQLKGYWLEAAGFSIDASIRVRVMAGCLVLTICVPRDAEEQ
jgi:toxic protein SymE